MFEVNDPTFYEVRRVVSCFMVILLQYILQVHRALQEINVQGSTHGGVVSEFFSSSGLVLKQNFFYQYGLVTNVFTKFLLKTVENCRSILIFFPIWSCDKENIKLHNLLTTK